MAKRQPYRDNLFGSSSSVFPDEALRSSSKPQNETVPAENTEGRFLSIEVDGQHYLAPTSRNGKQLDDDEAAQLAVTGKTELRPVTAEQAILNSQRNSGQVSTPPSSPSQADDSAPKVSPKLSLEERLAQYSKQQIVEKNERSKITPERRAEIEQLSDEAMDTVGVQWLPKGMTKSFYGKMFASGQATDVKSLLWYERMKATEEGRDLPQQSIDYLKKVSALADYQVLLDDDDKSTVQKWLGGGIQTLGQMAQAGMLTGQSNPMTSGLAAGIGTGLALGPAAATPPGMAAVGAATTLGAGTVSAFHTYQAETGQAFEEFSQIKDPATGQYIPLKTAAAGARMYGRIAAGLEGLDIALFTKLVPGFSKFTGQTVKQALLKSPTFMHWLLAYGGKAAGTVAAETATEDAQQLTQILVRDVLLKNRSVSNALKDPENQQEIIDITKKTATGMSMLAVFGVALGGRGQYKAIKDERNAQRIERDILAAARAKEAVEKTAEAEFQKVNEQWQKQPRPEGPVRPSTEQDIITQQGPASGQQEMPWQAAPVPDASGQYQLPGMGQPPVPPVAPTPEAQAPVAAPVQAAPQPAPGPVAPVAPIAPQQQQLSLVDRMFGAPQEVAPAAAPSAPSPTLTNVLTSEMEVENPDTGKIETVQSQAHTFIDPKTIDGVVNHNDLKRPAVMARDGSILISNFEHQSLPSPSSTKHKEEMDKLTQSMGVAMDDLRDQMVARRLTPKDVEFGYVVNKPGFPQDKPVFVGTKEWDEATGYSDKVTKHQYRNVKNIDDKKATEKEKQEEKAAKAAGADPLSIESISAELSNLKNRQRVRAVLKAANSWLRVKRPSFNDPDERASAVNAAYAEILNKVDQKTKGMPLKEKTEAVRAALAAGLNGNALNRLDEAHGKRREIAAKIKDKTLNQVSLSKTKENEEGSSSSLLNTIDQDGKMIGDKIPIVTPQDYTDEEMTVKTRTLTPEQAGVPAQKKLSPKMLAAAKKKEANLVAYFKTMQKRYPDWSAEKIFEKLTTRKDETKRWGPSAVRTVQQALEREKTTTPLPSPASTPKSQPAASQTPSVANAPKTPVVSSKKAEVKAIAAKEVENRQQERRSRDYVPRDKGDTDYLRGTGEVPDEVLDQAIGEYKRNDQLVLNSAGDVTFAKFKTAQNKAKEVGGMVLPTAKGTYVVVTEPERRVLFTLDAIKEGQEKVNAPKAKKDVAKVATSQATAEQVLAAIDQSAPKLGAPTRTEKTNMPGFPDKATVDHMFAWIAKTIPTDNQVEMFSDMADEVRKDPDVIKEGWPKVRDRAERAKAESKPAPKQANVKLRKALLPGATPAAANAVSQIIQGTDTVSQAQKSAKEPVVEKKRARAPREPKQANTKTREAAKQVASTTKDMAATVGDIMAIFSNGSGNTLSMMAPFSDLDKEKINALKPHFRKLWDQSKQLGWDVKQFVTEVIKMLGEEARPYFRQWADTDLRQILKPAPTPQKPAPVKGDKKFKYDYLFTGEQPPAETATTQTEKTPLTKADRMAKPRLTGKTAKKAEEMITIQQVVAEEQGITQKELQDKVIKWALDTNAAVVKTDGTIVYKGLKGIELRRRMPEGKTSADFQDGTIIPVGNEQYVIIRPVTGQLTVDEIYDEAATHTPLPEKEVQVREAGPKVGGQIPTGPTVDEMRGKVAKEEEEVLHLPTPNPKPQKVKEKPTSAAMLDHLRETANAVPDPQKLVRFLKEQNQGIGWFENTEAAWEFRDAGDRVVVVAPGEVMVVTPEQFNAFRDNRPVELTKEAVKQNPTLVQEEINTEAQYHENTRGFVKEIPRAVERQSDLPIEEHKRLNALNVGDKTTALLSTMYEAVMFDNIGQVMKIAGTKKDQKTIFLQKVRDLAKERGASKVTITKSATGTPSKQHVVEKVNDVPVTPQKLSDFINNQTGSTPIFEDVAHFVITMPKSAWNSMRETTQAVGDFFDVEAPWKRQGLAEIGFTIKNWFSRRDAEERLGMQEAMRLMKLIHRGFDGKQTKDDLTNIVLATENTGMKWDGEKLVQESFSPEWLQKAQPAIDWLTSYFKQSQKEFADRNVEMDFVAHQLERIETKLQDVQSEKAKARLEELRDMMKGMNFVHIPYRMLFAKKLREFVATTNEQQARQKMQQLKTIINKNRTAPTLATLLKERGEDKKTLINAHDINPAMVVMNYSFNKGLEHAMLDIRDSIVKYGDKVARFSDKRPADGVNFSWQRVPPSMKILETANTGAIKKGDSLWLRTDFVEALQNAMSFGHAQGRIRKVFSWIKLSAFYNPVILPMYNIFQLLMGGMYNPYKLAKAGGKAYHDVGGIAAFFGKQYGVRSEDYWDMLKNGGSSQPFNNPYADIEAMTRSINAIKGNKVMSFGRSLMADYLSRVKTNWKESMLLTKPAAPVTAAMRILYSGISQVAWFLDEFTRMIAYNYLRKEGHNERTAAQLTAFFLGDYASVPAGTRKALNFAFFTPTYEIATFKLYGKMIRAMLSPIFGDIKTYPSFLSKKDPESQTDATKMGRRLIYAGVSSAAMMGLMESWMRGMGWEPDEYLRKWTKRIQTPQGPKELVQTFSSPLNLWQRYHSMFNRVFFSDPGNLDPWTVRLVRAMSMKLHPVWQAMYQVGIENKTPDGNPIFNKFDTFWNNAKSGLGFALNVTSPIVPDLYGKVSGDRPFEGDSRRIAREYYEREHGKMWDFISDLLSFKYTRDIPDVQTQRQIKQMGRDIKTELKREYIRKGEIRKDWIDEYKRRVQAELDELRDKKNRR